MKFSRRMKIFRDAFVLGPIESAKMKLDKDENWTPLLIWIHATRMIIGLVLGFILGACTTLLFLFFHCVQ